MSHFSVVPLEKKSRALHRANFGCLKGVYALNVTLGCSFYCVYCYSRGYQIAPAKGTVYLYYNLPELLLKEVRRLPRETPVIFNTSSECFQPHPDILEITFRSLAILLKKGLRVGILSKGVVPDEFKELIVAHRHQISFTVDVVSLKDDYCQLFEPYAPRGQERLANAQKLAEWGIKVRARLDPLIPFLSDTEENIKEILKALKEVGIQEVVLSYLQLRPKILNQMQQELPPSIIKLLWSCFALKRWEITGSHTLSKLVPLSLRQKGYQRIAQIANHLGLKTIICRCKNPDMPLKGSCLPIELRTKRNFWQQAQLF